MPARAGTKIAGISHIPEICLEVPMTSSPVPDWRTELRDVIRTTIPRDQAWFIDDAFPFLEAVVGEAASNTSDGLFVAGRALTLLRFALKAAGIEPAAAPDDSPLFPSVLHRELTVEHAIQLFVDEAELRGALHAHLNKLPDAEWRLAVETMILLAEQLKERTNETG